MSLFDEPSGEGGEWDKGVHYFATGDNWVQEAVRSAESLKRCMPSIKTSIVTNGHVPENLFDLLIRPKSVDDIKKAKVSAISQSPFYRTVFLDTDTYVAHPFWELYDALDHYELAAAMQPIWGVRKGEASGEREEKGIVSCFPRLNTGVLAYRLTEGLQSFMKDWEDVVHGVVEGSNVVYNFSNDQDGFRQTLFHSELKWFVLPPAYNARLSYPNIINGVVKIYHDHHRCIKQIGDQINSRNDRRYFCPIWYKHKGVYFGRNTVKPTIRESVGQLIRRVFPNFKPYDY